MLRWALAAMLLFPTVQGLSMDFEATQRGPIIPIVEERELGVSFEVPCSEWFSAAAAMSGAPFVSLQVDDLADGLQLSHPTTVAVPQGACLTPLTGSTEASATLRVSGNMDVPALKPLPIVLRANLGAVSSAEAEARVQMEYVGIVEAKAPIVLKQAGPQKQISYLIELESFSNGRTRVAFELVTRSFDGQVVVPDQVILDAAGGQHAKATAVLTYSTPFENGENDVQETFSVRVIPTFALDQEKAGNETVLTFGANTKGMYVPGPGAVLLLGALAGVALLRRRP